jgi:hypothetical protein
MMLIISKISDAPFLTFPLRQGEGIKQFSFATFPGQQWAFAGMTTQYESSLVRV